MQRISGTYTQHSVAGEGYQSFVPAPLPPDPPVIFDGALLDLLERANRALGRLDGMAEMLPDTTLFIYQYVRKEAVLSSQIEGTQSSLSDLLLFELDEAPGTPLDDIEEVSSYVAALNHGVTRLEGGFPLSLRLIREMHRVLLATGRGASKQPGEFRRSQNWLGGTRPGNAAFVPPSPDSLNGCLDAFEKYLHVQDASLPILVRAGLTHVQFETIHPFLDGNGRMGRLLIVLILIDTGVLRQPILYLSLYFKAHRLEYYDRLSRVRTHGDWEGWLGFFLEGVAQTSQQAVDTARGLLQLFEHDRQRIREIGRLSGSALQVHQHLQNRPITNIMDAVKTTGVNRTSISNALDKLRTLGIARELTGNKRNRLFAYSEYLDRLAEGTEPLR